MFNKFFSALFVFLLIQNSAQARNLLAYPEVIKISEHKGKTFLTLMRDTIKPALDHKATEGFRVATGEEVVARLAFVEAKVSRKALVAAGSKENLVALADELHSTYESITFYELPAAISKLGYRRGAFDLTTFLSLVSHGGVAVQFDKNNISYNVNYGTGKTLNDERTGRSFGESHERQALDASDKHYLTILEDYVKTDTANIGQFYKTLLNILLNSDTTGFNKITKAGQAVASDFLAVYIAEQDRHLMSNMTRHPWDEALLEVTLLAAFHSGQEQIHVMYGGQLTATTLQQKTGCDEMSPREKAASLVDYWQFSSNTDPAHCKRSGINITRKDFRALGEKITAQQRQLNPELVQTIEQRLGVNRSKNLFADLSRFVINLKTAESLDSESLKLAEEFTQFLLSSQQSAQMLTSQLVTIQ